MNTLEVRIRNVVLSDLDRILELEQVSFEIDAFSRHTMKAYLENRPDLFFVAENSRTIIGYMISTIQDQKGLIVSIAVDPDYRRNGVGKSLVEFTFNRLRLFDLKSIELRVRDTNEQGISFWKNMGFDPSGAIPQFYSDNADAMQMKKDVI